MQAIVPAVDLHFPALASNSAGSAQQIEGAIQSAEAYEHARRWRGQPPLVSCMVSCSLTRVMAHADARTRSHSRESGGHMAVAA